MSMIDMKLSEEEIKERHRPSVLDESPKFPHGLSLHLEPMVAKKLGMSEAPKIDEEMVVMARVSVSKAEAVDDAGGFSVDLQIVAMGVAGKEKEEGEERSESMKKSLFGGSEEG